MRRKLCRKTPTRHPEPLAPAEPVTRTKDDVLAGLLAMTMILFSIPSDLPAFLQANRIILLANYDPAESAPSLFENVTHKNDKYPGRATARLVTGPEAFKRNGASLAIDYSISHPGSFSYVWTAGELVNLTGMNYLSFWRKLAGASREKTFEFYVELREDLNGNGVFDPRTDGVERLPASRFAVGGEKEGWQKTVIPLARFHRVRSWDRILQIAFVLENKRRLGEGRFLLDDLVGGSNFPEAFKGREIPMQNRVSSFKINHRYVTDRVALKKKAPALLTLTVTLIDPYLEEIRWETAEPGSGTWRGIKSFHDHARGGVYEEEMRWPEEERLKKQFELRAAGISLWGEEASLAGPFRITLD